MHALLPTMASFYSTWRAFPWYNAKISCSLLVQGKVWLVPSLGVLGSTSSCDADALGLSQISLFAPPPLASVNTNSPYFCKHLHIYHPISISDIGKACYLFVVHV